MSSEAPKESEKKKRVYYSARGGPRPKGADAVARANASYPSPTALETPLPRTTATHFLRGGGGNEWNYTRGDENIKKALENDTLRIQVQWQRSSHRMARTGLRGGARIPKPEGEKSDKALPKLKLKMRALSFGTRKKGEISTSLGIGKSISVPALPVSTSEISEASKRSLEQRLYEFSIASSDETQSVSLSNFTAPTFLLKESRGSSEETVGVESILGTSQDGRACSLSLYSVASEGNPIWSRDMNPERFVGQSSPVSPGLSTFKPADGSQFLEIDADTADPSSTASSGRAR